RFQGLLRSMGFEVKLTPYIQRADGSTKGDWDAGIAVDMAEYATHAGVLVLASGDGDFAPVVQKLIGDHGVAVEVYGVSDLTAASLRQAATSFVPIEGRLLLPIPTT
ncbi:MAG: NYN domain-containing protein, partial [Chloroflexi bacterium]|nr:NYN domain-containing protein [Chloroflexota bacterium]